jgi:hypothetical protein
MMRPSLRTRRARRQTVVAAVVDREAAGAVEVAVVVAAGVASRHFFCFLERTIRRLFMSSEFGFNMHDHGISFILFFHYPGVPT